MNRVKFSVLSYVMGVSILCLVNSIPGWALGERKPPTPEEKVKMLVAGLHALAIASDIKPVPIPIPRMWRPSGIFDADISESGGGMKVSYQVTLKGISLKNLRVWGFQNPDFKSDKVNYPGSLMFGDVIAHLHLRVFIRGRSISTDLDFHMEDLVVPSDIVMAMDGPIMTVFPRERQHEARLGRLWLRTDLLPDFIDERISRKLGDDVRQSVFSALPESTFETAALFGGLGGLLR